MNDTPPLDQEQLIRRISRDLADGYDEELEMEIEDRPILPGMPADADAAAEKAYRLRYFNDLFRLQAELVKLQDWVVDTREKVVIVFEGRDAAGKGGIIKRDHATPKSPRLQSRGPAGAKRSGAHAVVFPTLRAASAGGGGDRLVRPQLV